MGQESSIKLSPIEAIYIYSLADLLKSDLWKPKAVKAFGLVAVRRLGRGNYLSLVSNLNTR